MRYEPIVRNNSTCTYYYVGVEDMQVLYFIRTHDKKAKKKEKKEKCAVHVYIFIKGHRRRRGGNDER